MMSLTLLKTLAFATLWITLLLTCDAARASTALNRQNVKTAHHVEQAITALRPLADADSLAAAGLLSLDRHRDQSLPLIEHAIAAAPTRADLLWLQIEVCLKLGDCDPAPMENRLREIDPTNAAGWVGAFGRASASGDEDAIDAVLTVIGQKQRVDVYWTTLIWHLSEAIARTHKMSPVEALATIIGYLAAQPIPAYAALTKACKGERLQRAGVLKACQGVGNAFQHSDNTLAEAIGMTIAERVWPEYSPEWKAAIEARRVYDYRTGLWLKLNTRRDQTALMQQYLQWCRTSRREQDVQLAEIIAAGENPTPPAE
jgi:hypothetical protein